ncbi:SPOSA6832_03313 [Sporobolomyces salmonicolor]|uniref:SPOSA6832_03313-mRNA-1:cds n=1 Tax=Sporidiobolus salmonicolor TaxID=5005 RepID=A0A0D6ENH2_SPOSA|nr:SPOSA6832_03313 [Sporobolomyces salmonicolor]
MLAVVAVQRLWFDRLSKLFDFCLWAPPTPGQTIGDSEQVEVAWCTASGHGARVIPQGAIHSAHFLKTPHYIQVTGTGDFTSINIARGDEGGELDPHGATGNGNPIGGLVFSNGQQIHEWTSFISDSEFCFRVCPDADDAWDLQGCQWNEPGNYGDGYDSCDGDSTDLPPGIYSVDGALSTYQQSQGAAPTAHAAGASSNCQAVATVGGGVAAPIPTTTSAAASSSAVPSSSYSTSAAWSSSVSSSVVSSTVSSTSTWTTSVVSSSSSSSVISSSSSTSETSSTTAAPSSSVVTSTSTLSTPVTTSPPTAHAAAASPSTTTTTSGGDKVVGSTIGAALAALVAFLA